jgi:hypothetical protein
MKSKKYKTRGETPEMLLVAQVLELVSRFDVRCRYYIPTCDYTDFATRFFAIFNQQNDQFT